DTARGTQNHRAPPGSETTCPPASVTADRCLRRSSSNNRFGDLIVCAGLTRPTQNRSQPLGDFCDVRSPHQRLVRTRYPLHVNSSPRERVPPLRRATSVLLVLPRATQRDAPWVGPR